MNNLLETRNADRLLASVAKDPASGCWLWRGQVSNSGYGRIMLRNESGNSMESAHRASYAAFIGFIPQSAIIRQTCGNRLCVNPEHLEIIDADNNRFDRSAPIG